MADIMYYGRGFFAERDGELPEYYREDLLEIMVTMMKPSNFREYRSIQYACQNSFTRRLAVSAINLQMSYEHLLREVIWSGTTFQVTRFMEYYQIFHDILDFDPNLTPEQRMRWRGHYLNVIETLGIIVQVSQGSINLVDRMHEIQQAWETLCAMSQYFEGYVLWHIQNDRQ
jgi:acyl carrier protein phosphodiesterase